MHLDGNEEDYYFHIKNGNEMDEKRMHSHRYKKDRGKYKLNGIHRRGNKGVLFNPKEISSYTLRNMRESNGSKRNRTTKKDPYEDSPKTYVTFPIIAPSYNGGFKTTYSTQPIESFNSCQLVLMPLRAHFQRKNRDSDGRYHIILFEREIEKAEEYANAIKIMNSCLEEDSQLVKMIEGSYSA